MTVGLIPILGLIYVVRLVHWYYLKSRYPILVTAVDGEPVELAKGFRAALHRLWFAVLFWPVLLLSIAIYLEIT
jgi:hypothetical protein